MGYLNSLCSSSTLETLCPSVGVGLGGDAWVTPLTWQEAKSVRDHGLFDLCVDTWKPGRLIPWSLVGLFSVVAGMFRAIHHRGGLPSQEKLSVGLSAALSKYHPQEKLLWCDCDAHKRFCFCFVAIAVTAILCESKLWLWPEMTPVGDGCRKKEAVSVELASARSRTRRAMEEVDF